MIIEKIHIINFGKLSEFDLELTEGINIIEGKNESGKSTISAFIKFMFYGLPASAEERARCISWNSATAAGTLTVREHEDRYRIEREAVTVKSSDGKAAFRERCVVINEESGKPLYKGKVPGEVFFGIPRAVFESTAFIGQLEGTGAGGRTLAEATENILFSADETVNTKKALKKLDEARVYLYHKNRKGGKIYEYSKERSALAEQLTEAQRTSAEIINSEGTLRVLKESKEKAAEALTKTNGELAAHERYLIKQNYLKLRDESAKSDEAEKELSKLSAENRYGAGVSDERFVRSLENEKLQLIALETGMRHAQNELEKADAKLEELKAPLEELPENTSCDELLLLETKYSKQIRLWKSTAIVCVILAAIAVLLAFVNTYIAFAAVGAAIAACICFIISALTKKKLKEECYGVFECKNSESFRAAIAERKRTEAEIAFTERSKNDAEEKAIQTRTAAETKKAVIRKTLKNAKFAVSEDLLSDIEKAEEEARASLEKRRTLSQAKAAADAKIKEIIALLDTVSEEEKEKALTEVFDDEAMQSFDVRGKKREQEFLTKSISAQTEKIHTVECELATLNAMHARPAEIAQEINALNGKIDDLSEKFEAYMLAIDAIGSASGKLRDGISPQIAKSASKIMESLSDGKYSSVFVDSDFALSYSASGITRDIATLSAGTSDIAYISLRIALVKTLCKHSLPPFVFDESFTRLDNQRLTCALKMLGQTFEKNAQALIFTCHEREKTLAENAISSTSLSI